MSAGMTAASVATEARRGPAAWLTRLHPLLLAAVAIAIFAGGQLAWYPGQISPDVSAQFIISGLMRGGARLYLDIVEINPPLWFWQAMPLHGLAERLGVRPEALLILALALWSWLVVAAVLRLVPIPSPRIRWAATAYLVALLLLPPWLHLGQREHYALLAALPFIAATVARRQRRRVHPQLAVAVGLGAAFGLYLKPHFLLLPVLLEAWLLLNLRRDWRPFRPETVTFALAGLAYAAAIPLFTPDFLPGNLELLQAYRAANHGPPLLLDFNLFYVLAIAGGIGPHWRSVLAGKAPLTAALMIGAAVFLLTYVAQGKGWHYHALPAIVCVGLAVAASLLELGLPRPPWRVVPPAMLTLPLLFATAGPASNLPPGSDLAVALRPLDRGESFGLVSAAGSTWWEGIHGRGLHNASRYGQYWILIGYDQHPSDPLVRRSLVRAVRETSQDYRCFAPTRIVFTRFDREGASKSASADPFTFFMRFPEFRAVMRHYRKVDQIGVLEVWERTSTPAPSTQPCRRPGWVVRKPS